MRDTGPVSGRRPRSRLQVGADVAPGGGRTLVVDDPRRARGFFEEHVTGNVGIGRPEQIAAVFAAQVRTRGPRRTKGPFRTRVFSPGTEVKIDFSFKHSRAKQYLKEGRPLRIETVINNPADIRVHARLNHLPER